MNNINNKNYVYEYYLYLPNCQDKSYSLLNSLNENKKEEDFEKLENLFTVNSNKFYLEINNSSNEFGYFILNGEKINQKTLIRNNSYIIDFIVSNRNIPNDIQKIIDYVVSVEDEEAYSKECHISFTFKACYHSCQNCSFDILILLIYNLIFAMKNVIHAQDQLNSIVHHVQMDYI